MEHVSSRSSDTKYSAQAVRALAREAKLTNNWIKYGDTWYTPEELEAAAETRTFENGRLFLRDPVMSIRAGRTYIQDLEDKMTEFNIRVVEYYRRKS